MTIIDNLNQIFRMVFDDDTIQLNTTMTANDVEGWDSLSHINLVVAVESKFDIRFTQKELLTHRNVGDLIADIERKIPA